MTDKTTLAVVLALNYKPHKYNLDRRVDDYRDNISDAAALIRLANRLKTIAENQCNGIERYNAVLGRKEATWTELDEKNAERIVDKTRRSIISILSRYYTVAQDHGCMGKRVHVYFQNDPRGAMVRFHLKKSGTFFLG